jgi:hypothetical protein
MNQTALVADIDSATSSPEDLIGMAFFTAESGTFADVEIISSYVIVNISYSFSIVTLLAIEYVMGSMEAIFMHEGIRTHIKIEVLQLLSSTVPHNIHP